MTLMWFSLIWGVVLIGTFIGGLWFGLKLGQREPVFVPKAEPVAEEPEYDTGIENVVEYEDTSEDMPPHKEREA